MTNRKGDVRLKKHNTNYYNTISLLLYIFVSEVAISKISVGKISGSDMGE